MREEEYDRSLEYPAREAGSRRDGVVPISLPGEARRDPL